ncbi:aminobenzoyl-glutamate transport protein [Naumannella cuiyingiana]|uniref:Aminobenzoyl-glutamate transport protein n=1 Tax=Naumannella cuiyingiana TaxID=1347891 RepID=A0A7Z0D7J3_9ACTN|nr:aminobenzoyl-glutamate transport protein [Naumannella cuiyingiana]
MSASAPQAQPESRALRAAFRVFSVIERVGNKLPAPFWLFVILAVVVIVLSAILAAAGVAAVNPANGKTVAVQSLLSREGIAMIVSSATDNYAKFPPMATIITTMLGIAIADRSGLIEAFLRNSLARVPARFATFALSLAAMFGHVAGDAAYVTLIPLGALLFRSLGRSPILGIIVAFVSISAGYDAAPILTTTDVLLSSISTAAAQTIDPAYVVTPVSNYFFALASSVIIALTITIVTETLLARRPELVADTDAEGLAADAAKEVTTVERRALRMTGILAAVLLIALVVAMVPEGSWLRGEDGGITDSPVFSGMAWLIGIFFALLGICYGRITGSIRSASDITDAMIDGFKQMAPILVLFFAIAQFLAYFKWSGIGEVLAITGAEALRGANAPSLGILLGMGVVISLLNLMITSGSAMWSLASPIFVPMLMLLGIPPETTQAMYRIADSVTNCVTPMSPYFALTLGFLQRYRASAGIGTLASFTIPLAMVVWVVWMALFCVFYLLGIPFGPGAPATL